ncbi:ENR1 protein, partial [Cinclus mexicanus]|nr:ENR1 protein [Cinclus mexicanus]
KIPQKEKGKNQPPTPYEEVKSVIIYWQKPESVKLSWKTPNRIFWIRGKRAFNILPKRWRGTCTLGIIQPVIFTLPKGKDGESVRSSL